MASVIKLKRSSTQGSVPTTSDLATGEIAVNLFDRKLYVSNGTGVTAMGGEDFRLTSQDPTSGAGAYLKLLGDTSSTSNTVLLRGGTGITVARDGNGSISFTSTQGSSISDLQTEDGNLWSAITATNTAIRALVSSNDTDISNLQTEDGNLWSAITATNTAIRSITTANANEIGDVWSGLIATNTAIRSLTTANANEIGDLWSGLIATNTAIRALTSQNATNIDQKLGATATVQISGDVAGSASFSGNSVNVAVTQQNNSVDLGTHTTGNYVATIGGTANEITVSGSGSETAAVTIGLPDDVSITAQLNVGENAVIAGNTSVGGNMTVSGDLTVSGATTYLSTSTVYTDDGMFKLAANNAGDATDTGIYGMYDDGGTDEFAGYFRDASDGIFKFYTGLQVEPTSTVNVAGAGYALAQVDAVIDGGSY